MKFDHVKFEGEDELGEEADIYVKDKTNTVWFWCAVSFPSDLTHDEMVELSKKLVVAVYGGSYSENVKLPNKSDQRMVNIIKHHGWLTDADCDIILQMSSKCNKNETSLFGMLLNSFVLLQEYNK